MTSITVYKDPRGQWVLSEVGCADPVVVLLPLLANSQEVLAVTDLVRKRFAVVGVREQILDASRHK